MCQPKLMVAVKNEDLSILRLSPPISPSTTQETILKQKSAKKSYFDIFVNFPSVFILGTETFWRY